MPINRGSSTGGSRRRNTSSGGGLNESMFDSLPGEDSVEDSDDRHGVTSSGSTSVEFTDDISDDTAFTSDEEIVSNDVLNSDEDVTTDSTLVADDTDPVQRSLDEHLDDDISDDVNSSGDSDVKDFNFDGADPEPVERRAEDERQPEFIDKKKRRLLPFGSTKEGEKKNKKTLRVGDFDPRVDRKRQVKVRQYAIVGLLGAVFSVGVVNALFDDSGLSQQDVAIIAQKSTGYTNFPKQEGEGFALNFMKAFLNVNSDANASKVLTYYYTGDFADAKGGDTSFGQSTSGGSEATATRSGTSSFQQRVLYGPVVYDYNTISDQSGSYVIGALVSQADTSGASGSEGASASSVKNAGSDWVFFNVNVYYDEATDKFAIAPDSPSLVPQVASQKQDQIPQPETLGTGETSEELNAAVRSTVNGFVQGYSTTNDEDHSAIDQYVVSNPDKELLKGLDSQVSLSDATNSITYDAYPVEGTNQVKVRTSVVWEDKPEVADNNASSSSKDKKKNSNEKTTESKVTYTSRYIMTLEKQSDGRYLVSKFSPEYYVPSSDK